jgi:hypothetical protein
VRWEVGGVRCEVGGATVRDEAAGDARMSGSDCTEPRSRRDPSGTTLPMEMTKVDWEGEMKREEGKYGGAREE